MQYIPCNSALLAQEALFLPKNLKSRQNRLKIFVQVQTFRRVPPVLPRNFCHPAWECPRTPRAVQALPLVLMARSYFYHSISWSLWNCICIFQLFSNGKQDFMYPIICAYTGCTGSWPIRKCCRETATGTTTASGTWSAGRTTVHRFFLYFDLKN